MEADDIVYTVLPSDEKAEQEEENDDDDEGPGLTGEFSPEIDWDALGLTAVYITSYIGIAVVAYSFVFEQWSIVDSIYFAVSTFTTVGYGDLQPTTEVGQVFTIFFAVYGVIILGVFIGVIGHAISEAQAKAIRQVNRAKQHRILQVLFKSSQQAMANNEGGVPPTKYKNNEERTGILPEQISLLQDALGVLKSEFPSILLVVVLARILGLREGWSLTSSMYFALMSSSTTGYGDYTPTTQADKIYCIVYLPISVAVFGEVLGRIASVYIRRRVRRAERKFLHRSITMYDLRKMDTNQDGQVDMHEFISFMLVALQRCEQETLDDLRAIFEALDVNGNGLIEREDLLELNRRAKLTEVIPPSDDDSFAPATTDLATQWAEVCESDTVYMT